MAPALVHICPVKEVYNQGKREEVLAVGSGFLISADGYVVTNEHVAGKSKQVRCVLSSKEEVEAKVVGVDPYTDIAVLKLESDHRLPHVRLGVSATLESGQTVLALGSPHGLARSVSLGIVSVTDRHLELGKTRQAPYNNWIQTDAAINPGNSGGPLVNLRGEVVGVNARMLSGAENVGFAIPIDIAREVVESLIQEGRVRRSWLGLTLQEMLARTDDPESIGVVIADVDALSPAREAGVRPGDILLAVNGVATHARFAEDLPKVRKLIADLPVSEEAELRLARGGESLTIRVVTEEKSALSGDEEEFEAWGFTASELTPEIIRQAQLSNRQGILISGVQVGGLAAQAELRRGDVLLSIDQEEIENLAAFRQRYEALVEGCQKRVLLLVKRGALTRYVLLIQEAASAVSQSETAEEEGAPENVE